ncbi:VOC family protein [Nocardia sp. CDC159]|uniref:VOC family protein n=1 Tax=Nocardia pulmonis TaxID=2951408 RepID=A0A9X2E718_9NOCA|nr:MULTISPECIES: VOC family protein [Nocardia]MCM6774815.1 VOC family protein [Nocardia pulmonis]MCM6789746.1 VOC family protein [Nocardia sp. CDC159]
MSSGRTEGVNNFYHLCFAVQDIRRATDDLTRALGVQWGPVRTGRLGEWEYRIVFSVQGPPFFEVIQGDPGSPWDASGGSRFDHIGYWSSDITIDKQRLEERGAAIEFDACPYGRPFAYHRIDSIGSRVELVDMAVQEGFRQAWAPDGAPMAALDLDGPLAGPNP